MTDPSQNLLKLFALGMTKLSYGCLSIVHKHLGQDLELGLVAFAVVLRTRRDWFDHIARHGWQDGTFAELERHPVYTTSIYELARFTGVDRATVRRKLQKLTDMGLVERRADQRWHLLDFHTDGRPSPALDLLRELFGNYRAVSEQLEQLPPAALDGLHRHGAPERAPKALSREECDEKQRKGYLARD
ncbi:winged helix-turn-helix domain-containing protein [uncultured Thiohalocapsa sp.]|uniref:winged helix-turn-helix domain-containing protein n=1 Tax=uncultured Thiohalocapsa sp. TaxID=768990 RepID=UPI0025D7F170|nr:winged helix-turn-helix domain-containing protein [uncultured Thiohalocapsa sp.]